MNRPARYWYRTLPDAIETWLDSLDAVAIDSLTLRPIDGEVRVHYVDSNGARRKACFMIELTF